MSHEKIALLLTPPFDTTIHDPGYIKGYLPGVRENGAQYTHAALWAVLATALQGVFLYAMRLTLIRTSRRMDGRLSTSTLRVEKFATVISL